MNTKIIFAAAAALSLTTGVALAQDQVTRISDGFAVHYSDLDLRTAAGQETLAERVDWAVTRTCQLRYHRSLSEVSACRRDLKREVMANAAPEVRTAMETNQRRRASGSLFSAR